MRPPHFALQEGSREAHRSKVGMVGQVLLSFSALAMERHLHGRCNARRVGRPDRSKLRGDASVHRRGLIGEPLNSEMHVSVVIVGALGPVIEIKEQQGGDFQVHGLPSRGEN